MRSKKLVVQFMILLLSLTRVESSYATEEDLYDFLWLDPDKQVYVLQNKFFKKEKTFYANIGYMKGMSSDFQDTYGIQGAFGYYFNETWAVEAIYNKYSNSDNDAFTNLKEINQSVPFIRKPLSSYGVLAIWSPFYGKINTFNKIIYFDWSFGFGAGTLNTKSNKDTVSSSSTANNFADENYTTLMEKTALRFHISKSVHFGVDYYFQSYKAPGPTVGTKPGVESWRHNSDIILSVGLSF